MIPNKIHNIQFSQPFLPMKQLAKELGVSYKWLEREISNVAKSGVKDVVIEGIKYSVMPGRLKLSNRSYTWNPNIFYTYWFLPRSQNLIDSDRPLQIRTGSTLIFKTNNLNKGNIKYAQY